MPKTSQSSLILDEDLDHVRAGSKMLLIHHVELRCSNPRQDSIDNCGCISPVNGQSPHNLCNIFCKVPMEEIVVKQCGKKRKTLEMESGVMKRQEMEQGRVRKRDRRVSSHKCMVS